MEKVDGKQDFDLNSGHTETDVNRNTRRVDMEDEIYIQMAGEVLVI